MADSLTPPFLYVCEQTSQSNKPSKYLAFTVQGITEVAEDIFIGEQWEAAG